MAFLDAALEVGEALDEITVPLASSAISSATYNPKTMTLTLDMTDGTELEYHGVPPTVFASLVAAAGAYYNANIRGSFA
jgi:hypothetical protein